MISISLSARSNTCLFSIPVCIEAVRPAQQRRHTRVVCRSIRSGASTCLSVLPLCPACPPLGLPERPRRLPGTRGFFFNPSLDGGFELVELSKSSRRRSSVTSARRAPLSARNASFSLLSSAISRRSASISSRISEGRIIPTLTHISTQPVSPNPRLGQTFRPTVANRTHSPWLLQSDRKRLLSD